MATSKNYDYKFINVFINLKKCDVKKKVMKIDVTPERKTSLSLRRRDV